MVIQVGGYKYRWVVIQVGGYTGGWLYRWVVIHTFHLYMRKKRMFKEKKVNLIIYKPHIYISK